MNELVFSAAVIVLLALYFIFLYKNTSRHSSSNTLAGAFTAIFILGFILHLVMYSKIAISKGSLYDYLSIIFYSAQHSLKMFLAGAPLFRIIKDIEPFPVIYYIYIPLFYMAVLTSAFFIFNFLSRGLYSRRWLDKKHNRSLATKGKNSIFIGVNRYAEVLAASLRKEQDANGEDGLIIFLEMPQKNEGQVKLSIWDILKQFMTSRPRPSGKPVYDHLLKISGNMKGLMPWLENPENDVYILSENTAENVEMVEQLMEHPRIHCHIYCHARKEGLIMRYDSVADLNDQLTIIDSSYLAAQGLRRNPDLHPVNYVEVGTIDGRKAGWVSEKGFTSAILGFGETGKETLSFLYEFGAFPGKDRKKAPFKCYVYDNNMEQASGEYFRICPALKDSKEVEFISDKIGTPDFWKGFSEIIDDLNYIVISLGSDKLNLKVAIDVAELACRYRKESDHFVILFRSCNPEKIDRLTLDSVNKVFNGCIKPFGRIADIWTRDIITNRSINDMAEKFYNSYEILTNGSVSKPWSKMLASRHEGTFRMRCKAERQVTQNYADCLHVQTKRRICDPYYYKFADNIASPAEFDGSRHFIGKDEEAAMVMEYLAIGEKIRWNSSHEIMGYVYGEDTDDQKKTHKFLCPYEELTDKMSLHYDWLVVRNSFVEES